MYSSCKFKYRKCFKGRVREKSKIGCMEFGNYALKVCDSCRIDAKQLESARKVLNRALKKFPAKVFVRVYPHIPVTQKPIEVRMGKGKGSVDRWVARVRRGSVVFEVLGHDKDVIEAALLKSSFKLPVVCKVINESNFLR